MERLTTGILRRSSDAVVIIGLADGTILDVNKAFFTLTGHARRDLVGRPDHELLAGLGPTADPTAVGALDELGSLADAQVGLWTRSGELRVGQLSALVLEFEGQRTALGMLREVRDPTPEQRRSIAREELDRILRSGDTDPEAATRALRAFGRCLRWETGALWRGAPHGEGLRCTTEWSAEQGGVGQFEAATWYAAASPTRLAALRRAWHRRAPTWIPDVLADPELSPQAPGGAAEPMHGWLGFPALGPDGPTGMVEFLSRDARQPDAELLAMIEDFGKLFGQLLEHAETALPETEDPAPGTVPDAFRDLAGAVAAATEALERHPTAPAYAPRSVQLGELTAGMRRLSWLLENAAQRSAGGPPGLEPPAPSGEATVELPPELSTGLTLKAVSRRTGIPAATLRTWERRYGFIRPRRSPGGYRLYGSEEIARIERVKYLVGQGVRIGEAMKAVIDEAGVDELPDDAQHPTDQGGPEHNARHAEVYRLAARSPRRPRGRRS
jgi:DNA-binding transcriptional MerR regulator